MTHAHCGPPRCSMAGDGRRRGRRGAGGAAGIGERRRGRGCERLAADGLVRASRILHGEPALYVLTRRGLRAAGRARARPGRRSGRPMRRTSPRWRASPSRWRGRGTVDGRARAAGVRARSGAAAGERGGRIAARRVGCAAPPRPRLLGDGLPVAIEVELTVKAPERLRAIVRGWARSRVVAGVVYYAAPAAMRAVERAIDAELRGRAGASRGAPPRRVLTQARRSVARSIEQKGDPDGNDQPRRARRKSHARPGAARDRGRHERVPAADRVQHDVAQQGDGRDRRAAQLLRRDGVRRERRGLRALPREGAAGRGRRPPRMARVGERRRRAPAGGRGRRRQRAVPRVAPGGRRRRLGRARSRRTTDAEAVAF